MIFSVSLQECKCMASLLPTYGKMSILRKPFQTSFVVFLCILGHNKVIVTPKLKKFKLYRLYQ